MVRGADDVCCSHCRRITLVPVRISAPDTIVAPKLKLPPTAKPFVEGDTSRRISIRTGDELAAREYLIEERKDRLPQANEELERRNLALERKLELVEQLTGLLAICAGCKKVRNDDGYWQHVESYVKEHSEAEFTHTICPDCSKQLYPEIAEPGRT